MKSQISGPVGIGILVVVVALAIFFGFKFMKGPSQITPEEMRQNMMKGQAQQQELGQQRGGPRPPGAGGQPGSGGQ